MTYTLIAHTELASPAASITFMNTGNIPNTFTDLILVASLRFSAGSIGNDVTIAFNGSTSNFSSRILFGSGNATGSFSVTTPLLIQATNSVGATANTFANFELTIPNYLSSANKSFSLDSVNENNATEAYQILQAGLWSNTSPITSITLTPPSGNFVTASSATLYGRLAGSSGGAVVS